jgi:carbamoyl-phosphate synthase large subunit
VLIIGSGPIVIGQACEFDYSGSQACKALRAEGLEVVLVNSNPATIMTDPELADRTYVEPLTVDVLEAIIERERPDALLPTVGGQTALNLAVELAGAGVLDRFHVKLIGASIQAIKGGRGSPAVQGRDAIEIGSTCRERSRPVAGRGRSTSRAPSVSRWSSVRRSRSAASVAASPTTSRVPRAGRAGLEFSPVHEILIEESVIGLEGIRARGHARRRDNFVVICSIENIDPMGVHTGDSITVAPILTLSDKEYSGCATRRRRIIRASASRPADRTSSSPCIRRPAGWW